VTQPGARAPQGPTSFRPGTAFVPGCLSSVAQLPDTPGYARLPQFGIASGNPGPLPAGKPTAEPSAAAGDGKRARKGEGPPL
jgi:hypothetical protein